MEKKKEKKMNSSQNKIKDIMENCHMINCYDNVDRQKINNRMIQIENELNRIKELVKDPRIKEMAKDPKNIRRV